MCANGIGWTLDGRRMFFTDNPCTPPPMVVVACHHTGAGLSLVAVRQSFNTQNVRFDPSFQTCLRR